MHDAFVVRARQPLGHFRRELYGAVCGEHAALQDLAQRLAGYSAAWR